MSSKINYWLEKEIELNQKHEELLTRRQTLLQGTETYFDSQENRAASFISDISKARQRNEQLLRDIQRFQNEMRRETVPPVTPKFNTLKNNYWAMVKNVFPVWQDEFREYQLRHPGSPTSPRGRSPRQRSSSQNQRSPSSSPRPRSTSPRQRSSGHNSPRMSQRPPLPHNNNSAPPENDQPAPQHQNQGTAADQQGDQSQYRNDEAVPPIEPSPHHQGDQSQDGSNKVVPPAESNTQIQGDRTEQEQVANKTQSSQLPQDVEHIAVLTNVQHPSQEPMIISSTSLNQPDHTGSVDAVSAASMNQSDPGNPARRSRRRDKNTTITANPEEIAALSSQSTMAAPTGFVAGTADPDADTPAAPVRKKRNSRRIRVVSQEGTEV